MSECELCGHPMPAGETMFKFHGFSGPCPGPPLTNPGEPDELTSLRSENARLRKALETEQTMHAAWRKRAEEAETATPRGVLSICPNAKPVDPSQLTEFQSQREEDIKEHIRLARQAVAGGGEKDLRLCYPFSVDTCSNPKCPCRSELAAAAEMPSPDKETQCSPA